MLQNCQKKPFKVTFHNIAWVIHTSTDQDIIQWKLKQCTLLTINAFFTTILYDRLATNKTT